MALERFATWADVLAHAHAGRPLFYQAPLDARPTRFDVRRGAEHATCRYVARARTLRMTPPGAIGRGRMRTADPFTADAGHLDRFTRAILPG
jgi:hypothetical protein